MMLFGSTLSIHMQSFVEFFVTENGQTISKWVWVCVREEVNERNETEKGG